MRSISCGLAGPSAHSQVLEWVRQLGGTIAEPEFSRGVSADGLGNVFIAGSGEVTPHFVDTSDVFVSKYDAAGNQQWTQRIETEEVEAVYGVSADGLGNVYISGVNMGELISPLREAFVSKYNAEGVPQWTRQFGTNDTYDEALCVSADGIGNVYVVGRNQRYLFDDAFIRKYDAEGVLEWTRLLETDHYDLNSGVSADGLGNAYVVGQSGNAPHLKKYDTAGNLEWTQQLGSGGAVSADGLGNVFLSSPLRKFDATGNLLWTQDVGGGSVSADGLGNVYLSGTVSAGVGSQDVVLSKYDAAGVLEWTCLLETDQYDLNSGVSADGAGNIYVSGSVIVRPWGDAAVDPGEQDPFLAKFNDCPDCTPPPLPPIVVDAALGGLILPGSLVTHQFTTSFGDLPVTLRNLVAIRPTVNPPTLTESGLFSWQTTKLDGAGHYQFDVTATNAGGSDVGRLTLRLAIIPEPSAVLLVSLGIGTFIIVLRSSR